ncbi:MAG: FUN14 domain-containing protein [Verrucomicrobiae bacterium]|nr:FUN14 domain-containing protein [Verrucomicrobiae bacterium]
MATDENPSTPTSDPESRNEFGLGEYQFTRGKWLVLLLSVGMMVAGGILALTSDKPPARQIATSRQSVANTPPVSRQVGGMMNSFAESGGITLPLPGLTNSFPEARESAPASDSDDPEIGSREFSTLFVKGGFGMFMGFAIGFAIRAFVRLATVIVGFYFLTLTMLAYFGWIEIHWTIIEGQVGGVISNFGAQFASFKAFLTGSIPSSGAAATGLAMGLRKK